MKPIERHDAHYKALEIQPLDIIAKDFTYEEIRGYFKGNILKYLLRNKERPLKEYQKLLVYAQLLVELEQIHEENTND